MSKRLALIVLLLGLPSIALAQPTEPPPDPNAGAPAPLPPPQTPPPTYVAQPVAAPVAPVVGEIGGPPQTGFQLQARMATQLGLTSIITPGFSVGYRTGNMVIGAELGFTAGSLEDDTTTDSFSLIHIMPMIYFDVWQSRDGKARLNLVGGAGFGKGTLTSETMGMKTEASATFIPVLAGIGGDYYLHKNFALGVEVGAAVPILTSVEDDGMDVGLSGSTQSLHGMIRFTFVTGE